MMDYRIFSADSHFVEPATMWAERMDAKFRDRAPHTVQGYKGKEGEFFVCENVNPIAVAGFFGSGKTAEELPEHIKHGFEAAPKSVWDPAERLKEQDADGVSGEVLYPSMGMLLFGLDDAELRGACFRAFNDWAAEYCSYNTQRLVGAGIIELDDIPAAVTELERIAKKGLRGTLIWGAPPDDKPYSSPEYDPFWAAAQDLQMPLSLHILTGRGGVQFDTRRILYASDPVRLYEATPGSPADVCRYDRRGGVRALPTPQSGLSRKRRVLDSAFLVSARSRLRSAAAPTGADAVDVAQRVYEAQCDGHVSV